jgi:RNA polymerase sigma-70 factor (ECF subfamily)
VSRGPLLSTLLLLGCASARTPRPPTHEQLVNHHMQGKYDEVVRRSCASEAEAEALTREVFVQLWPQASRYEPNLGSEALFITMVARRCLLDRRRATEPRPGLRSAPESLASSESSTPIERCPEATLAAGVLATLDPSQRRMLSLTFGQGLTYAEVAKATPSSPDAAKSLIRRALVAVRKRLQARQGEALRE